MCFCLRFGTPNALGEEENGNENEKEKRDAECLVFLPHSPSIFAGFSDFQNEGATSPHNAQDTTDRRNKNSSPSTMFW